ncbi:MAG: hypothetical protein VW338_13315 [Rhodospirillaceae bacterium]
MNRADRRRQEKAARKRAKKAGGDPAVATILSPEAEQALMAALQQHGAGRLAEAEAGYAKALA